MAEVNTEAKAKSEKKSEEKISSKMAKKDFRAQVMQMWTISLVIAGLLVLAIGVQSFYVREEAEIRRESYLANLEQLYQQELQECLSLGAVEGEVAGESPEQCLERINQDGQYASLVRKWGGEGRLQSEL